LAHLPDTLTGSGVPHTDSGEAGLREACEALDAQAIRAALERTGGNRLAAAKALGIHKTTLFRKLRTLGIDLPEQDGRSARHEA
jgi:transcriptional regulator with PAS, ATPase and Fis domain